MSPVSNIELVTDFLQCCQSLCHQVSISQTKVELWPYRGLESQVFTFCLRFAPALAQQQIVTVIFRHNDGVCVSYPVMLLQSLAV